MVHAPLLCIEMSRTLKLVLSPVCLSLGRIKAVTVTIIKYVLKNLPNVCIKISITSVLICPQIVMLSNHPNPIKYSNIYEFEHGLPDFKETQFNVFDARKDKFGGFSLVKTVLPAMAKKIFGLPEVRKLYDRRRDFDLIIIDHMSNEVGSEIII